MRAGVRETAALRLLAARIEALADLDGDGLCALDVEAKARVKLYVDTWVAPIAAALLVRAEDDGGPADHVAAEVIRSSTEHAADGRHVAEYADRARGRMS